MKRMLIITILTYLFGITIHGEQIHNRNTLRQQMEHVKNEYGVKFVYDSSIKLDIPYTGKQLQGGNLRTSLNELFRNTGMKWELNGNYVVILPQKKYSISGYVTQTDGETVINATVWDLTSGIGTLTNEHGFYSLTLPEGKHSIRFSFIGNADHIEEISLNKNLTKNVMLSPGEELGEVVVTADLNSPLSTTQTGKISLTPKDLQKEYALLSSPDVVKILQNLPGVSSGSELISGLYVHGGGNDENLFMLDGTPLYQVNHLGGLFSAFNTDVIKNIDFYKSGVAARYGGRLSSVVDVRTKDGNMQEYHGNFSIGLLDGRIQFEGPIKRNRTSFNIAMRRTWLDVLTIPIFALRNRGAKDKVNMRYAFHDINAKVTHIFSDRSRADISIFSGNDEFKATDDETQSLMDYGKKREYTKLDLQWGNFTTAVNWKYQFSPKLYSVFTGIYTKNRSRQKYLEDNRLFYQDALTEKSLTETNTWATIDDIGARMEFDYRPVQSHHIRMGSNFLYHYFRPQSYKNYSANSESNDTLNRSGYHAYRGQELSLYAEDNIALREKVRVNLGVHYSLFHIPGKTYHSVEPRAAIRYQLNDRLTFKASYTEMNQFMHQLSNSYLNLPMDYWVPSTRSISPSRSRQYAAGAYLMLPHNLHINLEGYYKTTSNILEYDGGSSLTPSFEDWESRVRKGKSRAYGLEWETGYGNERWSLSGSYTLSWNKRNFPDFYDSWYPDKFDSRHKLNLNFSYKITSGIDAYASWSYHSGNRMTVPQQLVSAPVIPGTDNDGTNTPQWIYEQPNNISLPDYHRLDLGVNFRKKTKKGYERIWNVSIYNAYCRMNPFFAKIEQRPDESFVAKSTALFPIIPSFSYTLKF